LVACSTVFLHGLGTGVHRKEFYQQMRRPFGAVLTVAVHNFLRPALMFALCSAWESALTEVSIPLIAVATAPNAVPGVMMPMLFGADVPQLFVCMLFSMVAASFMVPVNIMLATNADLDVVAPVVGVWELVVLAVSCVAAGMLGLFVTGRYAGPNPRRLARAGMTAAAIGSVVLNMTSSFATQKPNPDEFPKEAILAILVCVVASAIFSSIVARYSGLNWPRVMAIGASAAFPNSLVMAIGYEIPTLSDGASDVSSGIDVDRVLGETAFIGTIFKVISIIIVVPWMWYSWQCGYTYRHPRARFYDLFQEFRDSRPPQDPTAPTPVNASHRSKKRTPGAARRSDSANPDLSEGLVGVARFAASSGDEPQ